LLRVFDDGGKEVQRESVIYTDQREKDTSRGLRSGDNTALEEKEKRKLYQREKELGEKVQYGTNRQTKANNSIDQGDRASELRKISRGIRPTGRGDLNEEGGMVCNNRKSNLRSKKNVLKKENEESERGSNSKVINQSVLRELETQKEGKGKERESCRNKGCHIERIEDQNISIGVLP